MNMLTLKRVQEKLDCSRSFVYKLLKKDPQFPRPVILSDGVKNASSQRWSENAIDEWLKSKSEKKDPET